MADNLSQTEQSGVHNALAKSGEEQTAHRNFVSEFLNSTAYAALEQPALGVSQFFGKDASNKVTGFFKEFGVEAPAASSGVSDWTAQTLGGAVGMLLPFALTKGALKRAGAFGGAATAETSFLNSRAAIGLSLKESAYTGFAYGAVLTPSKETDSARTLIADRLIGGVGSAATFTTLTAGSIGLGRLAETSVAGRIGVASTLRNPIVSGVFSGLPGGVVSAEYESITKHQKFASGSELAQSMAGMALVGGVFGAKAQFEPQINRASTFVADQLRSRFNLPKFENASSRFPGDGSRNINEPLPIVDSKASTRESTKESTREGTGSDAKQTDAKLTDAKLTDAKITPPPVELLPHETALLSEITSMQSAAQWKELNHRVEESTRGETLSWFSSRLERETSNLNSGELQKVWSDLIHTDPGQAYRVAKNAGAERGAELWRSQMESAKQNPMNGDAEPLARLAVLLSPHEQLSGVRQLLALEPPPRSLNMTPSVLAPENQIAAAKLLLAKEIVPSFESSTVPVKEWADWVFEQPQGGLRDKLVSQLTRRASRAGVGEVNEVLKMAQENAAPTEAEFEPLRTMVRNLETRVEKPGATEVRLEALNGLDAQFIGRLIFHESNWGKSDQIARSNPDLMRALGENTRLDSNPVRNDYLAEMLTGEPLTPSSLVDRLSNLAQTTMDAGHKYPLTYGDLEALAQHALKPAPNEVAPVLAKLREDTLQTFGIDATAEARIHGMRLLGNMAMARAFAKDNPALFESEFKNPIESAMADPQRNYERRLDAARALGELQRGNFEAAQVIHMPDLRMGKLAELSPEQQRNIRNETENALFDRAKMETLLGDGPLGRLMPGVFGFAKEGGIVGRRQHEVHDNTVDVHLLDVMQKAYSDPRFQKLLPQEQVNTLWASFLHDVSKRENMVDLDHGWTSTSTAWGILRTLGYPETQIQRITDIMGRDFDLSYDPDALNSVRFQDQKALDDVVTAYRLPSALDMVSILNASDIKSVKADGSWYNKPVIEELERIRTMAQDRVDHLNRHLLPVMTTSTAKGFGAREMNDYTVMVHTSPDITGQLLNHKSTIESPEFSMSVSLVNPEHRKLYTDSRDPKQSQVVAVVQGPFEHIAQAHRGNLSTGKSVGWDGHVELVRRWAGDHRAERLAQEAERKLEELGIPKDSRVAEENYPRLAQLRRILSQFETLDGLTRAAGRDNEYVVAANEVNRLLTTERDGTPIATHNEIKINNPIVSAVGLMRNPNQIVYYEGVPERTIHEMWNGNVPDYVRSGATGTAPPDALVVSNELVNQAKRHDLPIVVLNPRQ